MHLLATQPGQIEDGSEAVDLGQTPGEVLFLSAADTELAAVSDAFSNQQVLGSFQSKSETPLDLRLANLMVLKHNLSVDVYCDDMVAHAKMVIIRLLGGRAYWTYGVDQIVETCRQNGVQLVLLPGDDKPDAELKSLSTIPDEQRETMWTYLVHGGPKNTRNFLAYTHQILTEKTTDVEAPDVEAPEPLLKYGTYLAGVGAASLERVLSPILNSDKFKLDGANAKQSNRVALVFYRAHLASGNLAAIDALVAALSAQGLLAVPIYVSSLKDKLVADGVKTLLAESKAGLCLNTTSFAIGGFGDAGYLGDDHGQENLGRCPTVLEATGGPVLQVILSSATHDAWDANPQGLGTSDLAMNISLPEVDGRLITRAVSFKTPATYDERTQCQIVRAEPKPDRVAFVAELAERWLRLRHTPNANKRVAFVLANYPTKRARVGNGVGLDTPASLAVALKAMKDQAYDVGAVPLDGRALVDTLLAGPTNELEPNRAGGEVLSLDAYNDWFSKLPEALTAKVRERWGKPEDDPFVSNDAFQLALHRFGNVAIGIQPTRGYNIDPEGSYHDPDLVPPHGYLAFYAWIRGAFDAHAVTHFGKHGNLEWLPGKALALSENCFPDAVFGPTPNIYPFIVNDPGEGTQAKRRNQALVLDHLTPPLTRAETYGDLAELERLIDEYFEASTLDPRRLKPLKRNIFDLLASLGLDKDLGIDTSKQSDEALATLDAHLCELKELQIRDGLHIYGLAPSGEQKRDLLLALARLPQGQKPSFLKVLVDAYDLGFDPLACDYGAVWQGAKPDALNALSPDPWRTYGDTVERLELMAIALLDEKVSAPSEQMAGHFNWVRNDLGQLVERCGTDEVANFLKALQGEYVAPGPSGAPTRGRLDVLPTGRNFYSIDSRALPTAAAWRLGWQSANQLLNLHAQEHGDHLRRLAISMWGTANMRTGGDDIAQVLALLGVQPQWDLTSGRVTGFEVMPQSVLGRPRVDVTIRVSGFFRDAFPAQIDLMDSAIRAVAALDEPANLNPLAAEFTNDTQSLMSEQGMSETQARVLAGHRVFGSKPESYGAGLQALIDEGGWDQREELGQAYMAWSAFAYGHGSQGTSQADHFKKLLGRTQAIVHNQDNREHDILDSDDYYQFMGGLSSAVWNEQGQDVPVYHGDNSRPESPQVRSLEMEIARVMRSRVTNPKWIEGVMRHGYKGAFEMSATVDYLFGFAASTSAVASHHFDAVFKAYVQDDNVRSFLQQENPDAFADIVKRLQESLDRGLWQSKHNTIHNELGEWLQDPRA